jgi:uncharacterized paraquat-inducible protein A
LDYREDYQLDILNRRTTVLSFLATQSPTNLLIVFLVVCGLTAYYWKRERDSGRLALAARFHRSRVHDTRVPNGALISASVVNTGALLFWYFGRTDLMVFTLAPGVFLTYCHIHAMRKRFTEFERELLENNYRVCPECLYSLNETSETGKCPECGSEFSSYSLSQRWQNILRKKPHFG